MSGPSVDLKLALVSALSAVPKDHLCLFQLHYLQLHYLQLSASAPLETQ
jgi:hypothetical protein